MMNPPSAFVPCAGCARHVRAHDRACPFCGAHSEATLPTTARPLPRVSRAVLFAAGASLALAGVELGTRPMAYADSHDAVSMVPQYGAPSDYERPRYPVAPPPSRPDAGPTPPPDASAPVQPDGGTPPAR